MLDAHVPHPKEDAVHDGNMDSFPKYEAGLFILVTCGFRNRQSQGCCCAKQQHGGMLIAGADNRRNIFLRTLLFFFSLCSFESAGTLDLLFACQALTEVRCLRVCLVGVHTEPRNASDLNVSCACIVCFSWRVRVTSCVWENL